MPKSLIRTDRPEPPRASWQLDPDDPQLLRWHDGLEFTGQRMPRILMAAEDQTALLTAIRADIGTIKSVVVTWMGLMVVGGFIAVIILGSMHR